jgi:hypothetical protein
MGIIVTMRLVYNSNVVIFIFYKYHLLPYFILHYKKNPTLKPFLKTNYNIS